MSAVRVWLLGAAVSVGSIAADAARPRASLLLCAGVAGVAAIASVWLRVRGEEIPMGERLPRLSADAVALLVIGCACVGFANLGARQRTVEGSAVSRFDGRVVLAEGRVVSQPRRVSQTWTFTMRVTALDGDPADGDVQVRASATPRVGDRLEGPLKLSRLDPGDTFDRLLWRRGVAMKGKAVGDLLSVGRTGNPLMAAANHLRERMRATATAALDLPDAGLLLGMTIGDEELIPDGTIEDFRASGLSHLTAVSGANVAIVLSVVIIAMRVLRRSRRAQILSALPALLLFVLVTRWEPSVLRAALTSALALMSFFFGRRALGMHLLGLAFLLLVLADPNMLWSVGAQLSFAATASILLCGRAIAQWLHGRWRLPSVAAEAIALALSAQAGVWPLIAVHFDTVSVWSVPSNVLAFPLVAPITVLGFAAGLIGLVWIKAGAVLAAATQPLLTAIRAIAELSAGLPGAQVQLPRTGWYLLIVAYVLTAAVACIAVRRRRAAAILVTAVVAVMLFLGGSLASGPGSGAMRVTFFDVGQGDAALVESPGGARVLVDGGPDGELLMSLLSRKGIRRLDLVVFSHAHVDHISGLSRVLANVQVGEVVHPGVGSLPVAASRYAPVVEGTVYDVGDLRIEVLSPTKDLVVSAARQDAEGESQAINDASVVLRVTFGDGCVLFTGDIEEPAQDDLVNRYSQRLDCAVMKAPHHGSARLMEEFVSLVDPELVPISVGRNRFGHPTRRALGIFSRAGARVVRTDEAGDVVIEVGRNGEVGLAD